MRISDWSSDVCSSDLTCDAPYLRYSAPSANPIGVSPARKLPSSPERLPLTTDRRVLTVDPAGWLKKAIASSEISVPSPKRLIGTHPFAGSAHSVALLARSACCPRDFRPQIGRE